MEQWTPEKYEGADAAKMMEKISIDEKPGYTERHGSPHGEFHTKVSIQTPEKTYDSHVTYPRGHPENPMNEADWDEKLQTASSGKLSEVTLQRTKETILDLEREQSIRGIFPAVI
jgi:2-methylcitrate dehydratase PrpD